MKYAIRLLIILLFLAGCISLIYQSAENNRLAAEVNRLEAELGKMSIEDANRVQIVEIEVPDVPPEVASHVERVWQFRCYLPPGYDFMKMSGGGRVAAEGLYQSGGYAGSWGTPKQIAVHNLLTVSFQKKDNRLQAFYSFGGLSGTTSWNAFNPDRFGRMVLQKLVSSNQGPRSFDQDTILPLLRIYDPKTAEDMEVAGKSLTTYEGGQFVLCPRSREPYLNQLRMGETPHDFDRNWLATVVVDE